MEFEERWGLDPSIYRHAVVQSRRSAMSDRPRHELATLLPSDWDVGLACVLATVGTVPQAALHRFLAAAPGAAHGTGCDGWLAQLASRYGVAFDSAQLFALGNEKSIYNKIQGRGSAFGTFRSLPYLNGVVNENEDYIRGLHAAWSLSPLGASALRALSSREPLPAPKEFSFPTSATGYAPPNMIHDAQLSTLLMSLMVDFAGKAQAGEGVWDVADIFGTGERFGTGGSAMFPDAVVKAIAKSEQLTLIIENDSGAMTEARTRGKAAAYLRFMYSSDAVFTWCRPWLVFACPEGKTAVHERAITAAYKETGLLGRKDAPSVGRVAVITHEDVGRRGVADAVWTLYAPGKRAFLESRHPIETLEWCGQKGSASLGWRPSKSVA